MQQPRSCSTRTASMLHHFTSLTRKPSVVRKSVNTNLELRAPQWRPEPGREWPCGAPGTAAGRTTATGSGARRARVDVCKSTPPALNDRAGPPTEKSQMSDQLAEGGNKIRAQNRAAQLNLKGKKVFCLECKKVQIAEYSRTFKT